MIAFDIETAPLPDVELMKLAPQFKAPANYKDMDKIAAYQAEKVKEWKDGAALDARTGRIICVGIAVDDGPELVVYDDTEAGTLKAWWEHFHQMRKADDLRRWVGHNIASFDLPFLVRRSWILGVDIPCTFPALNRYLPDLFADTMTTWAATDYRATASLDSLAKAMGVGAKTGHGGEFYGLWLADRAKAKEYCLNDVRLTLAVAKKMRIAGWKSKRD